jgi:hypothetical protein
MVVSVATVEEYVWRWLSPNPTFVREWGLVMRG